MTDHLSAWAEPAAKLFECVAMWYKPKAIVKEAKAIAEAQLIVAKGEIATRKLFQRAAIRFVNTETRRQENIDATVEEASTLLPPTASGEPVSSDWMAAFMDNCQDVSEPEMRSLWAKILAGEVAEPNTFSRRTLNLLKSLDRQDAECFAKYCSISFIHSQG